MTNVESFVVHCNSWPLDEREKEEEEEVEQKRTKHKNFLFISFSISLVSTLVFTSFRKYICMNACICHVCIDCLNDTRPPFTGRKTIKFYAECGRRLK